MKALANHRDQIVIRNAFFILSNLGKSAVRHPPATLRVALRRHGSGKNQIGKGNGSRRHEQIVDNYKINAFQSAENTRSIGTHIGDRICRRHPNHPDRIRLARLDSLKHGIRVC